jgi:hypothetical protein
MSHSQTLLLWPIIRSLIPQTSWWPPLGGVRRLDRLEDSHDFQPGDILVTALTNIGAHVEGFSTRGICDTVLEQMTGRVRLQGPEKPTPQPEGQ